MVRKLLSKNILINIVLQITTICSGLIIPRMIIKTYGSGVNGLIVSITQFLGYIALLEGGIGGVIKSVLYKPLLNKDRERLGGIVNSTTDFFKKIAYIFLVYMLFLIFFFIRTEEVGLGWISTAFLVFSLGFSTLSQYFFGLTYQLVLQADQKIWLTSGVQIITIWINIVMTYVMIKLGCNIEVVKLVTALIFILRPLCYNIYVRKKYDINFDATPDNNALTQRWDGFGHHIAYFIHSNTDVILLTLFLTSTDVSIYAVYFMIVTGVRGMISAAASAVEPFIGRKIAEGDMDKVKKIFEIYEMSMFILTSAIFSACAYLIIPFIKLYTEGVSDANYVNYLFAMIIVASEAMYCLRSPYGAVIFAAGHFKQTKIGAFVEAGINITVSLFLIRLYGIVGVAFGTLIAMIYRTTEYAVYLSRRIICSSLTSYFKYIVTSVISAIVIINTCTKSLPPPVDYSVWIFDCFLSTIIALFIAILLFGLTSLKKVTSVVWYIKKRMEKNA